MSALQILGIIPARGGSKSIHKKSITPCAGHPLMFYTIEAAKRAQSITRLIVTTDDEEIADVARENGVEVPFMRPSELAGDTVPDLPVFEHVLNELKNRENYAPDIVVHLRPTTPLKKTEDIERGLHLLLSNPDAHSVRSVCEPLHTPFKMYSLGENSGFLEPLLQKEYPEVFEQYKEPYNMPRQLLPEIWRHSGYIDVVRPAVIKELHSMSGSRMVPLKFEKWRDVDIDTLLDLERAERVIQKINQDGGFVWD